MILSDGKNNFENNVYSYWEWSAPILQTHDEIISKIRELNLIGRKIKNVHCIGMAYNWNNDELGERIYRKLEDMTHEQRSTLPNPCPYLPEGLYLSRWIEIDEPFLIEFEDGDILGIDYSEGISVRMEMNTIPKNISFGTNRPTIHANKLFEDIIGKEICSVEVTTSTTMPDFTGSHGLDLDEQLSYVVGVSILYDDKSCCYPQRSLSFSSWMDYGEVALKDHSGEIMKIHAPDVKAVVEGFIEDEILNSQEEFDLTDFDS